MSVFKLWDLDVWRKPGNLVRALLSNIEAEIDLCRNGYAMFLRLILIKLEPNFLLYLGSVRLEVWSFLCVISTQFLHKNVYFPKQMSYVESCSITISGKWQDQHKSGESYSARFHTCRNFVMATLQTYVFCSLWFVIVSYSARENGQQSDIGPRLLKNMHIITAILALCVQVFWLSLLHLLPLLATEKWPQKEKKNSLAVRRAFKTAMDLHTF